MPHEADYFTLLDLFFELVESQTGKKIEPGQEWLNDAQFLAKKLYQHLVSMKLVADGATFEQGGNPKTFFVDHASVKVVARAALETYLVFYYLYGNDDLSLSEFRHKVWHIGGLADRQKFHPITNEAREKLALEKKDLDDLTFGDRAFTPSGGLHAQTTEAITRGQLEMWDQLDRYWNRRGLP